MNAKETDWQPCKINGVGLRKTEKKLLHDATALPHSRPRATKVQRAGTWRTKSGHMVDTHTHTADRRKTRAQGRQGLEAGQSGQTADIYGGQGLEGLKADARWTHGGHKADTCRQVADTCRTSGRQSLEPGPGRT